MLFRFLITFCALMTAAPALAQLPEPLEVALSAVPEDRAPDGVVLRMSLGAESIRLAIDYREGEEVGYRLLEPASEEMLTEVQADMWAGFNSEDEDAASESEAVEADGDATSSFSMGDYDPQELRATIGERASFAREENGRLIYEFEPLSLLMQGDVPGPLLEHLRAEVEVDPELGQLTAIRFTLIESFKPNLAARMDEFSLEQRFVHEPALHGPRTAGVSMSMAGSALFQPFSQTMRFDIEEVRFSEAEDAALETAAESP